MFASGIVVTRSAPVRGQVEDDLHALPSSLFSGTSPIPPGGQCVTLISRQGEAFSVDRIVFDSKMLSAGRSRLKDSRGEAGSHEYRVQLIQSPVSESPIKAVVTFGLRAASGRQYGLTLPVTAAL